MEIKNAMIDGNEAASYVAYRINDICAIYPITPASSMGELADVWASKGIKNIWNNIPTICEMQSEGGAAGAIHGALQAGALTTTFTASQGLLLMLPNMYKIAGELTSTVFHVAARSLATHALSIFCDHSDVMAARGTGFAILSAASVQEVMDFALIAQASTLASRIPFLFFFDGFRTSHEISKIEKLEEDTIRSMIDDKLVQAHKSRALNPEKPFIRGTSQNPDTFFQSRERVNSFYLNCPSIVQSKMDELAKATGRQYKVYEYYGHPEAEKVIVAMASACETIMETVDYINKKGEKTGLIKVRLYRPFDNEMFVEAIPKSAEKIAVLDRTKEPGSSGEPLYLDVVNAVMEASNEHKFNAGRNIKVIGGRFGLSSKEFNPSMVISIFKNLDKETPKNHFTIGINDDVTRTSLPYDKRLNIEPDTVFRALFYGLGSDGTVSANKNTIKIIGENTNKYAQGYFVYDSKKAGAITISHLRFGDHRIHSAYLIDQAHFLACHQPIFLEKFRLTDRILPNGIFLINAPFGADQVWNHLSKESQEDIIEKKIKVYVINATEVAKVCGLKRKINTIMQTCFFYLSGVLPQEEAVREIKDAIRKTYSKKGEAIVQQNLKAVDYTLTHLEKVEISEKANSIIATKFKIDASAPSFVKEVICQIIDGHGNELPVSAFPEDGTYPSGTTKYEKRNLATQIPILDPELCIECNKCIIVCPHATIRSKVFDLSAQNSIPDTLKFLPAKDKIWKERDLQYTIQVAPEDCTGCSICVEACPVFSKEDASHKALNMEPLSIYKDQEKENWEFFDTLPEVDRNALKVSTIRQQQFQEPLFEFSGACSGCGETPYIKLMTQLFGDRILVANATGCSSIYGGNLPSTPWTKNKEGRGPAWSNSLFEDNAEFGFGMYLAVEKHKEKAASLLVEIGTLVDDNFRNEMLNAPQNTEAEIHEQRDRIKLLKEKLNKINTKAANELLVLADYLVSKSVWIVGGDGWAYDIGYGGLDHVLASGKNVNILVLDTEVYSNTGGQTSKATPLGAIAKFSASGKPTSKKDLGMLAMTYGNVYVASVAFGAKDEHTLKAFREAEAYDGPSLIIAFSHCTEHGIDMECPLKYQKAMVDSGRWILYRYHPDAVLKNKHPLSIDSKIKIPLEDHLNMENRFARLKNSHPDLAKAYAVQAQKEVNEKYEMMQYLAKK